MTATADARTRLYDALTVELVESPWRVHRTSPAQIAAPCIYLESVERSVDTSAGTAVITATFPVVIVHDGTVRVQVEALDELGDRVWTAALSIGMDPTGSRPFALDVGGPSLRAHAMRVDAYLTAISLCPPTLIPALANGGM